jgi:hypothetical protein
MNSSKTIVNRKKLVLLRRLRKLSLTLILLVRMTKSKFSVSLFRILMNYRFLCQLIERKQLMALHISILMLATKFHRVNCDEFRQILVSKFPNELMKLAQFQQVSKPQLFELLPLALALPSPILLPFLILLLSLIPPRMILIHPFLRLLLARLGLIARIGTEMASFRQSQLVTMKLQQLSLLELHVIELAQLLPVSVLLVTFH